MLEFFITILLACLGLFILSGFIMFIIYWLDSLSETHNKIKFEDFKRLYEIDPNKWSLYTGYVKYLGDWPESYYVRFNFVDYCTYKLWEYNTKRIMKQQRKAKEYEKFVKAIKNDYGDDYKI